MSAKKKHAALLSGMNVLVPTSRPGIWAAAEMPRAATNLGLISASSYGTVGLFLHFISMAAFAVFVGAKSFKFFGALPQGASSTPTPSIPGLPVNPSENPDQ